VNRPAPLWANGCPRGQRCSNILTPNCSFNFVSSRNSFCCPSRSTTTHRRLAAERHDFHEIAPRLHLLVVDLHDAVAGPQSRPVLRAARIHPADNRQVRRHPDVAKNRRQHNGQPTFMNGPAIATLNLERGETGGRSSAFDSVSPSMVSIGDICGSATYPPAGTMKRDSRSRLSCSPKSSGRIPPKTARSSFRAFRNQKMAQFVDKNRQPKKKSTRSAG
jgi:hypothetical protein